MNLVTTTLHGRVKRCAKWKLRKGIQARFGRADVVKRTVTDSIAGHWVHNLTENGPDAEFSLPPQARTTVEARPGALAVCEAAWKKLLDKLQGRSLKEDDVADAWFSYFPLLNAINAEFRQFRVAYATDLATWGHLAKKTRQHRLRGDKPFSLLPHHSHQAKYITFDIVALKSLRREADFLAGRPMVPELLADAEIWQRSVRIDLVTTATRKFDYRFSTDGVSVSIQLTKAGVAWQPPPPRFPDAEILKSKKRIATMDEGRIDLYAGVW